MELAGYLFILLFFSVLDSLLIRHIREKTKQELKLLREDKTSLEQRYNQLKQEVKEIQQKINSLEDEIKEKEFQAKTKSTSKPEEQSLITDPLEYIRQKKIVPEKDIKRAEEYVKKTNTNLSVFDTLVLLEILDPATAQEIKEKIRREY